MKDPPGNVKEKVSGIHSAGKGYRGIFVDKETDE